MEHKALTSLQASACRRSLIAWAMLWACLAAQAQSGSPPQPGQVIQDCTTCPDLVVIPEGSFVMGSPGFEAGRESDEGPQHRVSVARFLMGQTEVTVGQFRRFVQASSYQTEAERNVGASGCYAWDASEGKGDWRARRSWRDPGWVVKGGEPVTCVSWNDAQAYLAWLGQSTGKRYVLPSEAQWEYAARAGTSSSRHWGDDPDRACRYANVADQSKAPTGHTWNTKHECNDGYWFVAPVANYQANAFGLFDMLGNVWEWTQDCWNEDYRGAPADGTAWQSGDCARRVVRGGGWDNFPAGVRAADRGWDDTADRLNSLGFRVARTAD